MNGFDEWMYYRKRVLDQDGAIYKGQRKNVSIGVLVICKGRYNNSPVLDFNRARWITLRFRVFLILMAV